MISIKANISSTLVLQRSSDDFVLKKNPIQRLISRRQPYYRFIVAGSALQVLKYMAAPQSIRFAANGNRENQRNQYALQVRECGLVPQTREFIHFGMAS